MFDQGEPLLPMLAPVYRRQIALFGRGGRAISRRSRGSSMTRSRAGRLSRWQKGRLIARDRRLDADRHPGGSGAAGQRAGAQGMNQLAVDSHAPAVSLARSRHFCEQLTRHAAKNFYYGLRLLPEPKPSSMFALYAFMRLCRRYRRRSRW